MLSNVTTAKGMTLITELHELNQITKGNSWMDALQQICRSMLHQNGPGPTRTRRLEDSQRRGNSIPAQTALMSSDWKQKLCFHPT